MTNNSRRSTRFSPMLLALLAILLAMSLGFAVFDDVATTTLVGSGAASARAGDLPVGGAIAHEAAVGSPANPGWALGAGAAVTGVTSEWGLAPRAKSELGAFLLLGSGISGFVVLSLRRRGGAEPPASIADR